MGSHKGGSVRPSDKQTETRRVRRSERDKIRKGLVYSTQQGILSGTYETPERVSGSADRLLVELDLH